MFERPAKKDIDAALSILMHEARRQTLEAKNRIFSEAAKAGALQSNRVIVIVADAADKIHAASLNQATQILRDFVERMETSATEITGWSRPHLENLSNSVLGVIPPNGFPTDHRRITNQYRTVFQQRVDLALRAVEIGYVRGTGFSARATMSEEEWICAAAALALTPMNRHVAARTICKRAHADLIKARAVRFIRSGESSDNIDVPTEFWWAEGEAALTQNWETGDFETYINNGHIRLEAFGVTFRRSDIEKLIGSEPIAPKIPSHEEPPHLERNDQHKRKIMTGKTDRNVFINCPFDEEYTALRNAIIFAVVVYEFIPRCALETSDASEVHIQKIYRIIDECTLGIHDLCRTEIDKTTNLPRFNMPLELGIFLGGKFLGNASNHRKACLVFDEHPYRYQMYLSDVSGQDINWHKNDPKQAVYVVRNWLASLSEAHLPSG